MSFILRVRQSMPSGLRSRRTSINLPGIAYSKWNLGALNFSQPAMTEEDDDEEVEIDQRSSLLIMIQPNLILRSIVVLRLIRVFKLVDEVSGLTLREVTELSSILMKKLGMIEPPVVGVMKAGAAVGLARMAGKATPATAEEETKPEKTVFELKLESYEAASKIKIIKEVKSFTDLGLKKAKDLVEKTPSVLKKGVSKEEAEQIIEKMQAVGAKVIME